MQGIIGSVFKLHIGVAKHAQVIELAIGITAFHIGVDGPFPQPRSVVQHARTITKFAFVINKHIAVLQRVQSTLIYLTVIIGVEAYFIDAVYFVFFGGNHIAIAFYKVAYIGGYLQFSIFLGGNCIAHNLKVDRTLLKSVKTIVAEEFV